MPKAKAKAASKSSSVGGKRPVSEIASSSTCVAKLEHSIMQASAAKSPCDRKRAKTEGQSLQKIMQEHFPGFSDEELYVVVKDGFTCFGRVSHDRERIARGENITMGKYYYIGLRALYQSPNSTLAKLVVKNEEDPEDDDLLDALAQLCEKRRSNEELLLWCDSVQAVNQMNIIGLFRTLLKFPASKSESNMVVTIAVMKMLCRLGYDEVYSQEVTTMAAQWDAAASRSLQTDKNHRETSEAWWRANQDWARLVLPKVCVDAVFAGKSSLVSVSDEIDQVVQGSETGRKLLGHVQRQVLIDRVSVKIEEEVEKLKVGKIDQARLSKAQADWVQKMQDLGYNPKVRFPPKQVSCQYRSERILPVVTSNLDHYCTAVQAFVRCLAVDAQKLPALWGENELITKASPASQDVDADGLRYALASRTTLKSELDDDDASGENITKTMQAKKGYLNSVDRYWKVEQSFWEALATTTSAAEKIQLKVLACLPSKDMPDMTLQQSDSRFEALENSQLANFVGPGLRTNIKTMRSYVSSMLDGKPPVLERLGGSDEGFAGQIRMALANFCRVPATSGSDAMVGGQAATHLAQGLVDRHAKGEVVQYKECSPVWAFSWLLEGDLKQKCSKMRSEILVRSGASASAQPSSAASSSKAAGPKQASDKHMSTKDMVRAIFKNKA